jgi:RNA ligase
MIEFSKYPQTHNLYASNGVQGKGIERGPKYGFSKPSFGQIGSWLVTEKLDGQNIRVILHNSPGSTGPDPEPPSSEVFFRGRSDNAQLHPQLTEHLQQAFTVESLWNAFAYEEHDGDDAQWLCPDVVLYGEGYGPGIQKAGAAYGGVKRFALFDVLVSNRWWLSWKNIEDVASKLGVETVPVLGRDLSLSAAKLLVRSSRKLEVGSEHIEGIVCRTDPYLFDGHGSRVTFKYKVRDLTPEEEPRPGSFGAYLAAGGLKAVS